MRHITHEVCDMPHF